MLMVNTIARQCSTAVLSVCLRAAVATLRNKHERVLTAPHAEQGDTQRGSLKCLQLAADCMQLCNGDVVSDRLYGSRRESQGDILYNRAAEFAVAIQWHI